jgi:rod shape-determining protein MreD
MTSALSRLLPSGLILLTTLAGALPWGTLAGGNEPNTSSGVMLPLAIIFACGLWQTANTPAWVAFAAGLLADALTAGPLGYWPLLYLLGLGMARSAAQRMIHPRLLMGTLTFAGAALLLGFAAWAVSSLYQLHVIGWRMLAWPVGMTIAAFPILAGLLMALTRWADGDRPLRGAASE